MSAKDPEVGARCWAKLGSLGSPWQACEVVEVRRAGRTLDVRLRGPGTLVPDLPAKRVRFDDPYARTPRRAPAPLADATRSSTSTRTPGRGIPKARPLRSADYLAFVRLQRCARCRTESRPRQAHHTRGPRGTGTKTDDFRSIALCAECHHDVHGSHAGDVGEPGEIDRLRAELTIAEALNDTLIAWLRQRAESSTP